MSFKSRQYLQRKIEREETVRSLRVNMDQSGEHEWRQMVMSAIENLVRDNRDQEEENDKLRTAINDKIGYTRAREMIREPVNLLRQEIRNLRWIVLWVGGAVVMSALTLFGILFARVFK